MCLKFTFGVSNCCDSRGALSSGFFIVETRGSLIGDKDVAMTLAIEIFVGPSPFRCIKKIVDAEGSLAEHSIIEDFLKQLI